MNEVFLGRLANGVKFLESEPANVAAKLAEDDGTKFFRIIEDKDGNLSLKKVRVDLERSAVTVQEKVAVKIDGQEIGEAVVLTRAEKERIKAEEEAAQNAKTEEAQKKREEIEASRKAHKEKIQKEQDAKKAAKIEAQKKRVRKIEEANAEHDAEIVEGREKVIADAKEKRDAKVDEANKEAADEIAEIDKAE